MSTDKQNFYVKHRRPILRNTAKYLDAMQPHLIERYGPELSDLLRTDTLTELEVLLPQIPYIGGRKNSMTNFLVQCVAGLALYRVFLRHKLALDEAREMLLEGYKTLASSFPMKTKYRFQGIILRMFPRLIARYLANQAVRSQQREYSGDFVFTLTPAEDDVLFGLDYHECGVVKFFSEMDAAELAPTMCEMDYIFFGGLGIPLKRKGTLAQGCTQCDFRFMRKS